MRQNQDESQDRQDLQCPAVCRGVIDLDTALVHYLLNVAQAQWVCCVPASAHQHDFQWIVQPLEHLAQLAYHCHLGCVGHAVIVRHRLLRQNQKIHLFKLHTNDMKNQPHRTFYNARSQMLEGVNYPWKWSA